MPNNVSSGFDRGYVSLDGAPGADSSWDDLFPPEGTPATPPQSVQGTNPQSQTPQTSSTPSQPFLQAGQTVYLTPEAAVEGTIHKDQYIDRVRTFLKDQGFDPNKLERVPESAPQVTAPAGPNFKYYGQGQKYFDALAGAADRRDRNAYEQITREYNQEALNATLAPYGPLLAEVARQRAIRQVSDEIPDFQRFAGSPEFRRTIDSMPLIKELANIGESDPNAAARLPEVYKTVYLMYQGTRNPQVSSPAPLTQAPPVQNTPTARPTSTMPQSTLTPPAPAPDTRDWTTNREARKQLIKDGEQRVGMADWSSLGM
jgi:hypothetical protein